MSKYCARSNSLLLLLTCLRGPPSHFIGWHNEYAVSPAHPAYLILFCKTPPENGGETSVVNSIAMFDRLKKAAPGFLTGCADKGLVYQIPHSLEQVGGIVGGNGLFKESAFGPKNGGKLPDTPEGRRAYVEKRIIELAQKGGWHEYIDKDDDSLPAWQRRGFNWTWHENGDLEVVHRVAGIRVHPTQNKPAIFNVSRIVIWGRRRADEFTRPCPLATPTPMSTTPSSLHSPTLMRTGALVSLSHPM